MALDKIHVVATPEIAALLRKCSREASAGALEAAARAFEGALKKRWTLGEVVSLLRQMASIERLGGSRESVPLSAAPLSPREEPE